MLCKTSILALAASLATTVVAQSSFGKVCVIPSLYVSSNGTADDSPAINAAFASCGVGGTIVFRAETDYNVFTPVSSTNISNAVVEVQGNLHLPQNVTYVQGIVNATSGYWFTFKGTGLQWLGTGNVSSGWIYSYGQAWWDANTYPGTGLVARPHLMSMGVNNLVMTHFKSSKPIGWNINLSGSNITITDTIIDAYSTSGSFPFNTDGFDISAQNVVIKNSVIYNGDDAIAVSNGAHNILFQTATIGYQTHGMSIGSLGSSATTINNVSNVLFDDVSVINGVYGARFKSYQGGQGLASNISWTNIRVYNVSFPIFVTQSYSNQAVGAVARPNNASVIMSDFNYVNWTGTVNSFAHGDGSCVTNPCWYDAGLPNLDGTQAVVIECNTASSCLDFTLRNIEVFPQKLAPPTAVCVNCTLANNPMLGFAGVNGTFVPTD